MGRSSASEVLERLKTKPKVRRMLATAIRERRVELGLSQVELANLAIVEKTRVTRIECGFYSSFDFVQDLADVLGLVLVLVPKGSVIQTTIPSKSVTTTVD